VTTRVRVACVVALSGLLFMNGCAPEPVEEAAPALPIPPVPPPPPPRRLASPTIHTSWTFRTGGDDCAAEASAQGVSLQIAVQRDVPMRLSLVLQPVSLRSGAAVPLRFNGTAGSWRVVGRATGPHALTASLGSDAAPALSHILVLLSGGLLEVGEGGASLANLDISPSDRNGQVWFDCARSKVL
jgi:hypothetical protein